MGRISVSVIRHDYNIAGSCAIAPSKPNYRRAFVPGGCWFFTVWPPANYGRITPGIGVVQADDRDLALQPLDLRLRDTRHAGLPQNLSIALLRFL